MSWRLIYFSSSNNESYVNSFIKSLDRPTQAKVVRLVRSLEQLGPKICMPYSKPLGNGLYELRIRGKQEVRIIYGYLNESIVLLHGFIKKTQKTPIKEINIAQKRMSLAR